MIDIILQGTDLEIGDFKQALKALVPEVTLLRRQDPSLRLCGVADDADLSTLKAIAQAHRVDCIAVPAGLSVKRFKLFCTDMDNTLIENECIDDMAYAAGRLDELHAAEAQAALEKRSFQETLRARLKTLAGAPAAAVEHAVQAERFSYGAEPLVKFFKRSGLGTYIISCGFTQIAEAAAKKLGMTGVVCNELLLNADGSLTGRIEGPAGGRLLDADGKRRAVEILAQLHGAKLSEVICIGDGANDVEMIRAAGLGVAYHPKAALANLARVEIQHGGMDVLAHLFIEAWRDAVELYRGTERA